MWVLIATQNKEAVEKLLGAPFSKQQRITENTMSFRISSPAFNKLIMAAKDAGYNPYALFTW